MNKEQSILGLCLGTIVGSFLWAILVTGRNQNELAEMIIAEGDRIRSTSLDSNHVAKNPPSFINSYDLPHGSNIDGTMMNWKVPETPKPPILLTPPEAPKALVVKKTEEEILREQLLEQIKNNSSGQVNGQLYMLTEEQLLSLVGTIAKNNNNKVSEELKNIAENNARQTGEIQEIKSLIQGQSTQQNSSKSTTWRTVEIE